MRGSYDMGDIFFLIFFLLGIHLEAGKLSKGESGRGRSCFARFSGSCF